MRRREFITLVGGTAAWTLTASAQQQPKMLRVGFVGMQPRESPLYGAFLKRMAELGYQEGLSRELESTLHRALAGANHREHDYATLEHLLLALIDDQDASAVMKACNVDLGPLKKNLANYIDNERPS